MKSLDVLKEEQTPPEVQEIFRGLKKKIGMVPNLYKVEANSPVAFKAFLDLGSRLEGGFFSPKEVQAIYLATSQSNECTYCLAAHTALGKMAGFSEEETLELRTATIQDEKLRALTGLAKEITQTKGHPGQERINEFFRAGYGQQALVELVGMIAFKTFSNYLNHIADTPIDFPEARDLQENTPSIY